MKFKLFHSAFPSVVRRALAGSSGVLLAWSGFAAGSHRIDELDLTLVPIPAGAFAMGSPDGEPGRRSDEGPKARVTITRDFWLARTEVTHAQWKAIMKTDLTEQARRALADDTVYSISGKDRTVRDYYNVKADADPQRFVDNPADNAPMCWVNWDEAVAFCRRLTERERAAKRLPAGYVYRLPTEAEWEYACRAGTEAATYAGALTIVGRFNAPVLDEIAWYGGNSSVDWNGKGLRTDSWKEKQYPGGMAAPREVGTKQANPFGMHDMIGNLWEWCGDWYAKVLPVGEVRDPTGAATGTQRVSRGGSWNSSAAGCRAARRFQDSPGARFRCVGFRIALAPAVE
jgi:sulfatase modifying factor 1